MDSEYPSQLLHFLANSTTCFEDPRFLSSIIYDFPHVTASEKVSILVSLIERGVPSRIWCRSCQLTITELFEIYITELENNNSYKRFLDLWEQATDEFWKNF